MTTYSDAWIGQALPEVSLASSDGRRLKLPQDIQGKWTILYFYPKDDTPGCTRQACSYRDHLSQFREAGVELFGISADDLTSHGAFAEKFSLNFPLLADTEHALSEPLGVYGEQEWNGKKYRGLSRDTFLVDPQGKVRHVWRKVNPDKTMEETLAAARKFMKA